MIVNFALFVSASQLPGITEPYPPLTGCDPTGGAAVPQSPDPLVRYQWGAGYNLTGLQTYTSADIFAWTATPTTAFGNLATLGTVDAKNVVVRAAGALRLDFGCERAAWFEFRSPDLSNDQLPFVSGAISEYNEPWQVRAKVVPVTAYANGTF